MTDCQAISYTACGSTPQASYNTRARARRSAQRKTREPDDTFPLFPHTAGTVSLCHTVRSAYLCIHTHKRFGEGHIIHKTVTATLRNAPSWPSQDLLSHALHSASASACTALPRRLRSLMGSFISHIRNSENSGVTSRPPPLHPRGATTRVEHHAHHAVPPPESSSRDARSPTRQGVNGYTSPAT